MKKNNQNFFDFFKSSNPLENRKKIKLKKKKNLCNGCFEIEKKIQKIRKILTSCGDILMVFNCRPIPSRYNFV